MTTHPGHAARPHEGPALASAAGLALDTLLPTPTGWTTVGELNHGDVLFGGDGRPCRVTGLGEPAVQELFEACFGDHQTITAAATHPWQVATTTDRFAGVSKTDRQIQRCLRSINGLLSRLDGDVLMPARRLHATLWAAGCDRWHTPDRIRQILRERRVSAAGRSGYPAREALVALDGYLRSLLTAPNGNRVLTTRQLIDTGTATKHGQTRFAVPLAAGLDIDPPNLLIPPYVLGAWLGDGSSRHKMIAAGNDDAAEMTRLISLYWAHVSVHNGDRAKLISCDRDTKRCKYGHADYGYVVRGARPSGRQQECHTCRRLYRERYTGPSGPPVVLGDPVNVSLHHLLRAEGLIGNKHIPPVYLRGSAAQRLLLLQGLMDTDGTVKNNHTCRITLTNRTLAAHTLELVRSLGIKAMFWTGSVGLTENDPDRPGQRRHRRIGNAHTVFFRTSRPVFRMGRKLERLPENDSMRSRRHYIQRIRPAGSGHARPVAVDSADGMLLVGRFIPTRSGTP